MKTKIFLALVISALVLGASAPAVVEEASAPEVVEEAPSQEAPAAEAPAPAEDAVAVDEISFSQDLVPILEQWAYPAHSTQGAGGVFLANYADVIQYVIPGNPGESMLYRSLTGDGAPIMPPSGKLPDETIQLFYDWILQGAKDN